jgi:hypothetical protein
MAKRVGTRLGRFVIEAELARGAMGMVCRARDPKIDRTVAIKTISLFGLEPEAEAEYRERFFIEAQAAGRLSHPGIVTVFDVGEEAETRSPYIVMEYVAGQSLQDLLSRENQKLSLGTALELAQEIAEALHYAHAQGVVHRDIKPANILLTAAGRAKIADFGIAKLNQAHLTLPGHVLGSPAFMAPEQLSGEGVDARSDLFSLGVILYTMLTGHRPFQGNSATTVCFKVVHHEPLSVTAFDSDFPAELAQLVSRAMAKSAADRYQTGQEMALAIQGLRESTGLLPRSHEVAQGGEPTSSAIPAQQKRFRLSATGVARWVRAPWSVVLPVFVLIAGIIFFFVSRVTVNPPPPVNAAATLPDAPVVAQWPRSAVADTSGTAMLQIEVTHDFAKARISVWSDKKLVYSQMLQGENKSRALVLRQVQGRESDTVWVPAGKHQLKVRVQSDADRYDHTRTVAATFALGGQQTLQITSNKKHNLLQVALR